MGLKLLASPAPGSCAELGQGHELLGYAIGKHLKVEQLEHEERKEMVMHLQVE